MNTGNNFSTTYKSPGVGLTSFIAIFMVMAIWIGFLVAGEEVLKGFQHISGKLNIIDLQSAFFFPLLIFFSIALVFSGTLLLICAKDMFIVLLFLAFVFSEMRIPLLNETAFAIRNIFILTMISYGIAAIILNDKKLFGAIQVLGCLYIFWCAANLVINGLFLNSLMMLPMQLAIVFGIFIGMQCIYPDVAGIRKICLILGWLGFAITLFHLGILLFVPNTFIAGRFCSLFILPTNFANSYVLLYVAVIWLAMWEKRMFLKICIIAAAIIGIFLLLLSGTRNSILTIMVAILCLSFAWRVKIPLYVGLTSILLIALVTAFFQDTAFYQYVGHRFTNTQSISRHRVWELAWSFISAKPFTGYGLGRAIDVMSVRMPTWALLNTHNAYIGIWMQLGIVGVILVIIIYFVCLAKGFQLILAKKIDGDIKKVIILPLAMLAALLIAGIFEENLTSRGSLQQLLWSFSVTMIIVIYRIEKLDYLQRK